MCTKDVRPGSRNYPARRRPERIEPGGPSEPEQPASSVRKPQSRSDLGIPVKEAPCKIPQQRKRPNRARAPLSSSEVSAGISRTRAQSSPLRSTRLRSTRPCLLDRPMTRAPTTIRTRTAMARPPRSRSPTSRAEVAASCAEMAHPGDPHTVGGIRFADPPYASWVMSTNQRPPSRAQPDACAT